MTEWLNLRPPAWLAAGLTQIEPYALPAAGLLAIALAALLIRSVRRTNPDTIAVRVAVLLASAFSAQGMYEVATQRLGLPWWIAGGLFVVAEAAMLASGVRAHRMWERTSRLGPHGRFVWAIAVVAGFIVSLNAHSPSEYVLRLAMPLLAAGLWWMGYVTDEAKARAVDAITYRWSLRRIGVVLGIIEPGDRDLATVNADRLIRRMTTHAHGVHHGRILRGWHRARLRRLTLLSDDAAVTEVQQRVARVHFIETSTAPTATPVVLSPRWWLTPWASARSAATALDAARRSAAQDIAAAQHAAADAAQQRDTALRDVELRIARAAETQRLALAEFETRLRAEHAAQIDAIRQEHREQLAMSAAQRSGGMQRTNGAVRPAQRSAAPRSTDGDDGERSASNAPALTDDEAVDALLRAHRDPRYPWRPTEVHNITGAGFRRIPKLLGMLADRHAAGRASAADDPEIEPVEATG